MAKRTQKTIKIALKESGIFGMETRIREVVLLNSDTISMNIGKLQNLEVERQVIELQGVRMVRYLTRYCFTEVEGEPNFEVNKAMENFLKLAKDKLHYFI